MPGAGSPSPFRGCGGGHAAPVLPAAPLAHPVWSCPVVPPGDAFAAFRLHQGLGMPRGLQRWRKAGLPVGTSPRAPPLQQGAGLHYGGLRRRSWGVRGTVPSGVPGMALPLSWGSTVPVVRGGRSRASPLRSIPLAIPPSPQAKPLARILRSIPVKAAAPPLLPLSSEPGSSRCRGQQRGLRRPGPPAPSIPGRCGRRRKEEVVPARPPRPHHAGRERIPAPGGC